MCTPSCNYVYLRIYLSIHVSIYPRIRIRRRKQRFCRIRKQPTTSLRKAVAGHRNFQRDRTYLYGPDDLITHQAVHRSFHNSATAHTYASNLQLQPPRKKCSLPCAAGAATIHESHVGLYNRHTHKLAETTCCISMWNSGWKVAWCCV